jgi:hypothetical protein
MHSFFMHEDAGIDVQYYLLKHPEDCRRIAGLPDAKALIELGKIEARLPAASSGPADRPKPTTSAKPPNKPVVTGSPSASDVTESIPADKLSLDDFYELEQKRTAGARR